MRIPTYYRRPSWQLIFSGMAIGAMISWGVFLFIHGEWQEEYGKLIKEQEVQIENLNREKKIWQDEFEKLNKQNEEQLTVQEIIVYVTNYEKFHLDLLSQHEIENKVKEDISLLIAKDIETVYKSRGLLKKSIENKTIIVNDKRYKVTVTELVIYTTLSVELKLSFAE
ncbi:sporulation protein [Bacillaceae bacterium Marseille-Q3522]|nr:sporulation protein [Bacillaceae bacterium Marseille-Q3522]